MYLLKETGLRSAVQHAIQQQHHPPQNCTVHTHYIKLIRTSNMLQNLQTRLKACVPLPYHTLILSIRMHVTEVIKPSTSQIQSHYVHTATSPTKGFFVCISYIIRSVQGVICHAHVISVMKYYRFNSAGLAG